MDGYRLGASVGSGSVELKQRQALADCCFSNGKAALRLLFVVSGIALAG
jgi:hypothetical protein